MRELGKVLANFTGQEVLAQSNTRYICDTQRQLQQRGMKSYQPWVASTALLSLRVLVVATWFSTSGSAVDFLRFRFGGSSNEPVLIPTSSTGGGGISLVTRDLRGFVADTSASSASRVSSLTTRFRYFLRVGGSVHSIRAGQVWSLGAYQA